MKNYSCCPLCGNISINAVREESLDAHPLHVEGLPTRRLWVMCCSCSHVYSHEYWGPEEKQLLFEQSLKDQVSIDNPEAHRRAWAPIVRRAIDIGFVLPSHVMAADCWLDVGCGNGALLLTAEEYGFAGLGVDARQQAVANLRDYRVDVEQCDVESGEWRAERVAVISLCDIVEHVVDPRALVENAHRALRGQGVLVVSYPNTESMSWRVMDVQQTNPYWRELEHLHNFSRPLMEELLRSSGFRVVDSMSSQIYLASTVTFALKD